jgi:hypothetical protein
LPARRDRTRHNAVADLVTSDPFPQFLDDADRFVPDHQASLHRIFATQNVEIGAADRRERNADDRFTHARARSWNFFHADLVRPVKNIGPHRKSRAFGWRVMPNRNRRLGQESLCIHDLFAF